MANLNKFYVNEHNEESERLEKQVSLKAYSLEEEFQYLNLENSEKVLDAGCGTGVASRYLLETKPELKIEAIDFSEIRLEKGKQLTNSSNINFKQGDLEKLDFCEDYFDTVFSRYVFEHLSAPEKVASELYRVCRPGGIAYLIDLDGVFINFHSTNEELNSYLEYLKKNLSFDLEVGRKLPSYLKKVGFKNIMWTGSLHTFKHKERQQELENNRERCIFARPTNRILSKK